MILLFYEHGLITAYWVTVVHIPFTQIIVTSIGLGYHSTWYANLPYTHYEVARLPMNVYNVCARVERQIAVIKVTDNVTFSATLYTLAYI
jgi:hypothetical protein